MALEHPLPDGPAPTGVASAGQRLSQKRCFNHAARSAVARCPRCERFFCRECVTEHEGRVICASCLRRLFEPGRTRRIGGGVLRGLFALAGMAAAWAVFYYAGRLMLGLSSTFHEGTIWGT